MEDYIVRIYRRKDENGGLFGVVEVVGLEGKKAFRSMAELVRLLRGDPPDERRGAERIRLSIPATSRARMPRAIRSPRRPSSRSCFRSGQGSA